MGVFFICMHIIILITYKLDCNFSFVYNEIYYMYLLKNIKGLIGSMTYGSGVNVK